MFCAHPPFQIDGNLGGCAGIAEMLIQSQQGFIEVLPALPAVWKEGSFKGLCVRGGGVVDASWKAGRLEKLTLHSRVKSAFKLKIPKVIADKVKSVWANVLYSIIVLSSIENP